MSSSRPEDVERRVQAWLDQVGWERNPFAQPGTVVTPLTQAEDEAESLEDYFAYEVVQRGWPTDEDGGDELGGFADLLWDDRHSVLFARGGEGKTATRLVLARELEQRDVLVVEYLQFDPHFRSVEEHAQEIELLASKEIGRTPELGPARSLERLAETAHECKEQGRVVFVLVDNVGRKLGPRTDVGDIERAVEHLFNPRLLDIDNLRFKFFLRDSLASRLVSYDLFQGHAIECNVLHVRWTKDRLEQLLKTRIGQVCEQAPTLKPISADEREMQFDLDGEIIQFALEQPGCPRTLLRLANEVICVHARDETDVEKFRLTRRDLIKATQSILVSATQLSREILFISYANRDVEFAQRLNADLRRSGVSTWINELGIRGGDDWPMRIATALMGCKTVLVIVSPDSMASKWVRREVEFADKEDKCILPLIHRRCEQPEWFGLRFGNVQWVDFSTGSYEANLAKLLTAIEQVNPQGGAD
jgi:hypothetical protein